ncbi:MULTISPECIES: HAD family hydrolase [Streptomyces]|uniref:hypothetical protein n=1 Tax=Streptomyces TaxID=1883 RepID=UPI00163B7864|nr:MULTISPECIES: hypothetical protein [Streptomyces]MBC2874261.1 hypothetical protein [Streptomyces sp. TYQ1024]UBI40296.1 hypothetical protein K7I03_30160 [Streptomyces mobaraensis]UKW32876.1 hypothetical protein MCU78_30085 [Streptomyces sp. TYQ1024]
MTGRDHEPFAVVFLDVNGTLVPSEPGVPPEAFSLRCFRGLVRRLTSLGVAVGLCSDSPLEQLWEFGVRIGLGTAPEFPVIAENGNVVAVGGAVRVITPFPALPDLRAEVTRTAVAHGLARVGDVAAPEFGGRPPFGREWAFGANRRASASVFGAPDFIRDVRQRVTEWCAENHCDISVGVGPDGSYAGIHPYARVELGKRVALAELAARDPMERTLMVGNSLADWVPGVPGVGCAFVADTAVPQYVRDAAWYVSPKSDLEGVIDVLWHVVRRQPPVRGSV